MLAMFMASLDQTIVATALPTIAGEFGALDRLSWIVTAYLLTTTATMPLYGRLSDMYGRRPLMLTALGLFTAGSILCGAAGSIEALIAFRAVQGLGGGGLMTIAFIVVADVIAPRERGRYQAYISSVFLVSSVAGPVLGGYFAEHLTWRWIFYVNLPLGALAAVLAVRTLSGPPRPGDSRSVRIDVAGTVLMASAVACVLLALAWGGVAYPWLSPTILALAGGGATLFALFVARQRKAAGPIVPPHLFRNPTFVSACATATLATMVMLGGIAFLPFYLQVVAGIGVSESGLYLLPLMFGIIVSAVASGRLVAHTGRYRIFPVVGLALAAGSFLVFAAAGGAEPGSGLIIFLTTVGLGLGMVMPILTVSVQNAVDRSDLGSATSSLAFFRSIGGAVGVALFGAVLSNGLEWNLPETLSPATRAGLLGGGLLHDGSLAGAIPGPTVDAFAESYRIVFAVAGTVCVLAWLAALSMRELTLRREL